MYSFEYDDDKESFSILGDIDQLFENREIKSFFKTFSIINQNQLIELSKLPIDLRFRDISFLDKNWNNIVDCNKFLQKHNTQ